VVTDPRHNDHNSSWSVLGLTDLPFVTFSGPWAGLRGDHGRDAQRRSSTSWRRGTRPG